MHRAGLTPSHPAFTSRIVLSFGRRQGGPRSVHSQSKRGLPRENAYVEIGAWHSRRGERPSSRSTFGKGKGSSYDERLQWAHNGRKLTQCESHEAIRCLVNGRPLRSRSASRGRTFFRSIRFTTSNFLSGCRYLNSRLSRAAPPNRRRGRRRPAIAGVVFRSISVAETEEKSSLRLFGNLFGQAHSASR